MSYNAENYRRVRRMLEERRLSAVREADTRLAALHAACPPVAEIDRRLAATGRKLFRVACLGGDDLAARVDALKQENLALVDARNAELKKIGLPPDYTDVHYTCPQCMDTGFTDTKMCDCMRRALVEEGFRSSGIGALIDRQNFDNFSFEYYKEDKDALNLVRYAYDECRRYAEEFRPGAGNLLLMGGTGLGKTHLSTAVARRVIERGFDVQYESAQNIFSAFEYDRFRSRGDDPSRSEKYMTCELLIMDDLGTEMQTPFTLSCLYNLLNTRLCRGNSTLINTNLTEKEIFSRYEDRITSRLLGEFKLLLLRGQDIRKQRL